MDRKQKRRRRNRARRPDTLVIILGGAFGIAALVTAFFAFRFVSEFVSTQDIIDLPGEPVSSGGSDQDVSGEQGSPDSSGTSGGGVGTAPEIPAVEWDGVSRVNILVIPRRF